jgi:hypothetical protein
MLLNHEDLGLVAELTRQPRAVAKLAVGAVLAAHDIHARLERVPTGYVASLTVVSGEAIVTEAVFPICWADLSEAARFGLLALVCKQLVLGGQRSIRQAERALQRSRARTRSPSA